MSAGAEADPVAARPHARLRHGVALARYTAWGVGGPAEHLYEPADLADLAAFVAGLPAGEPLFWLGLGSNVLIRDGGIPGTVILTAGRLGEIALSAPATVRVEAGAPCAKVARFCARAGLVGAEFLAGIPGTMGGALAMNAGAWGGETWPLVRRVQTLDRAGHLRWRGPADFTVGYRSVKGPAQEWFVGCELGLEPGDAAAATARIRELLARRTATQPTGQRSCGSVFRNPPGDHAARLIEACGLKGRRIGGAEVSTKHANFIINTGGASAADIEALVDLVARTVEGEQGVILVPEVRVVGVAP